MGLNAIRDAETYLAKEQPMERKVFTYKDVEEARGWIGKVGRFSNDLECCENGPNGEENNLYGGKLLYVRSFGNRFVASGTSDCFQFFMPDPIPVEKWVPFTAEDWELFFGKAVRTKRSKTVGGVGVQGFDASGVDIRSSGVHSFQEFLEEWTFLDGTPCGKKVLG